jgi:hypothetical protein
MFESFYMAGFECATGLNVHGEWIDQITATGHDVRVDEDYARLVAARVRTLREAVRWPLVDRGGSLDFTSLEPFLTAARRHGVQVIWDLFHYGYPLDLDPFGPEFSPRFARYCAAAAEHIARALPGPHFFTPINEASYFAWAAGEVGRFAPHALGRGHELKIALARAALSAVRAIRSACPGARIVTVDPICHVVPPLGATSSVEAGARHFSHHVVFQFLDMVAGRLLPELGGSRDCLDIVGVNYYWTNQWEVGREQEPLDAHDPRRVSVAELVRRVAERYGGPVVITETAGVDASRAPWIDQISSAAVELLAEGVPLAGVCLYPILGMPEWHDRQRWTSMGIWDVERPSLARTAHLPALRALARAQRALRQGAPSRTGHCSRLTYEL